jgi:hypothetical protein
LKFRCSVALGSILITSRIKTTQGTIPRRRLNINHQIQTRNVRQDHQTCQTGCRKNWEWTDKHRARDVPTRTHNGLHGHSSQRPFRTARPALGSAEASERDSSPTTAATAKPLASSTSGSPATAFEVATSTQGTDSWRRISTRLLSADRLRQTTLVPGERGALSQDFAVSSACNDSISWASNQRW